MDNKLKENKWFHVLVGQRVQKGVEQRQYLYGPTPF